MGELNELDRSSDVGHRGVCRVFGGDGGNHRMKTMYELWVSVRRWVLERLSDDAETLRPPNGHCESERYRAHDCGIMQGIEWYSVGFAGDATDIQICGKYEDASSETELLLVSTDDFRMLAFWYLWQWAWGEWFGLRRRLYWACMIWNLENIIKGSQTHRQ